MNDADIETAQAIEAANAFRQAVDAATVTPDEGTLKAIAREIYQTAYFGGSVFETLVDACAERDISPDGEVSNLAFEMGQLSLGKYAPRPGSEDAERAIAGVVTKLGFL